MAATAPYGSWSSPISAELVDRVVVVRGLRADAEGMEAAVMEGEVA